VSRLHPQIATDLPVVAGVVIRLIGTVPPPEMMVTPVMTVYRKIQSPVSSKQSRGSYTDKSTFWGSFGILYLLVRFVPSWRACICRAYITLDFVARSLVSGLLRYNHATRSTVAMALQSPWIYCDLDDLEKAFQERVSST